MIVKSLYLKESLFDYPELNKTKKSTPKIKSGCFFFNGKHSEPKILDGINITI